MPSAAPVPVTVLSSCDPATRGTLLFRLVADQPGRAALVYEADAGEGETAIVRWWTLTGAGVSDQGDFTMEPLCVGCLAEDVVPRLRELAAEHDSIVLAPPLTALPLPLVHRLAEAQSQGRLSGVRLAQCATAIAVQSFASDLLDPIELGEVGRALWPNDPRSLGEAISDQMRYADVLFLDRYEAHEETGDNSRGRDVDELIRRVCHPGIPSVDAEDPIARNRLFTGRHQTAVARHRFDLRNVCASCVEGSGAWTLELRSDRPFHPGRFLELLEDLGTARVCTWGHFWLPTRPGQLASWDGAGGQVSIGVLGESPQRPGTHLVFVGTDSDQWRIRKAFEEMLLTDEEWVLGPDAWTAAEDDLEPWLGEIPAR